MLTQLKKEITGFFSNLTGYLVIIVFLMTTSLFLWVLAIGNMNIPDYGYATLEPLFTLAPWIFLFLIPAITMKMFAEEKKSRTLELLLTRPVTDLEIILAKYLAAIILVIASLLPTLLWYWSVTRLGSPPGNIDSGATWGSYLGLLFLAAIYASVGIFISSTTDNQIISFILTAVLCFFLYTGFEAITSAGLLGRIDTLILKLGISEHYRSMSRGVLDTRDMIYFLSMICLFILLTKTVLERRNWK
jgi:ABC-2 type transport system permease protein